MRILLTLTLLSFIVGQFAFEIHEREHARKAHKSISTFKKSSLHDSPDEKPKTFKLESSDIQGTGSFDQDLFEYKEELQDFKKNELDRYVNQKFRELAQDGGLNTNTWRRLIDGAMDVLDFRHEGLSTLRDQFQQIDKNKDGLIDINEAKATLNEAITLAIRNIEDYLDRKTLLLRNARITLNAPLLSDAKNKKSDTAGAKKSPAVEKNTYKRV